MVVVSYGGQGRVLVVSYGGRGTCSELWRAGWLYKL